jgi:hypothetical protein
MTIDRPTLRQVLDSGQDPLDVMTELYQYGKDQPRWVLFDILRNGIEHSDFRARRVDELDRLVADLDVGSLTRGMFEPGVVPPDPRPGFRDEMRHMYGWEREVSLEPALCERVVFSIADPMIRTEMATKLGFAQSPHPFEVVMPEGSWRCDSCGACFEAGDEPAIVAGERPDFSTRAHADGYDPTWCAGCFQELVHQARDLRVGVR